MPHAVLILLTSSFVGTAALAASGVDADPRNIRTGLPIPDEGYCDQPYVVITRDGNWLCTLTTGKGEEGDLGQHVVSTITTDRGRTWSPLVDIEPADGPEASWVMPLITPSGRVYVFYDYNGDRVKELKGKPVRADMLGWYCYRWSDDNGRTWSGERKRLPVRVTAADRNNDWGGEVQIFWGIGKPITFDGTAMFGFTKLGKYMLDQGEGWFFRSDNILSEPDVDKIAWQMLPEGDHGVRAPQFGSVQEEHNLVWLGGENLYCFYRTTMGHPCHAYSTDGGRNWSEPEYATYTPGGRRIKHPRACPKIWRAKNGNYLLWYHNHGGMDFEYRNPAWICGGVVKDGRMHWSQPEILLYDPDVNIRMSYPDLIEQDGKYWITETQKTVARVHEIDPTLLAGMWAQGGAREVSRKGMILGLEGEPIEPQTRSMPRLPELDGGGFTIDMQIRLDELGAGQVILDSRDAAGRGLLVDTTDAGTIRITMDDGSSRAFWDSDPGALRAGQTHHVGIVVDAGPRIIMFVVDGQLCDGGTRRQYGWGRFVDRLRDTNGAPEAKIAHGLKGRLRALRLYDRPLRTSELVASHHATTR